MPDSPLLTPAFLKALATMPIEGRENIPAMASPYLLPNTLNECKRLDLQHFIFKQFFKRQYFAPIGRSQQSTVTTTGSWNDQIIERVLQNENVPHVAAPKRILDVGCGTGQWALDMAKQFPQSAVVGVDIVPPARPFTAPLPPNFAFLQANILQPLTALANDSFDFVHMRCLGWGIPATLWQSVLHELVRVTAHGGWIETVEADLPRDTGPAYDSVRTMLETILSTRGVDLANTRRIDSFLRQATTDVQGIASYTLDIPVGANGGGHGPRMAWNILLELDNLTPFFLQTHCWEAQPWRELRQQIEAEFEREEYQPSVTIAVTIGQKR
jgi:SAM-dependent methyltransferase